MMNQAELKSTVEAVVRENIHSGRIVDVIVSRDEDDRDGDYITVYVVYDKVKRLDPAETLTMRRLLRDRLLDLDETGFPVISFIIKSEAGDLAAA